MSATNEIVNNDWFAVYPCAYKLDIENECRLTEEPRAVFKNENQAQTMCSKLWPTTGEVRPVQVVLLPANIEGVDASQSASHPPSA